MLVLIMFTGFLVGIVSTYFGIGGGVIIVPALYTIFPSLAPETVISTSLAVITLNNLINMYAYYKKGLFAHYKLIIPLTLVMLIGVFLGIKITFLLPATDLKRLFSLVLVISALFTYFRSAPKSDRTYHINDISYKQWILAVVCFFIAGIISTTTGIGGGVLVIPIFIHLLRLPYKLIPVNTNFVVLIGVLVGVFLYLFNGKTYPPTEFGFQVLQLGPINLNLVLLISFFAFFTSYLGIRLSQKSSSNLSKRIFAIMLLVVAVCFFVSTI